MIAAGGGRGGEDPLDGEYQPTGVYSVNVWTVETGNILTLLTTQRDRPVG